MPRDRPRPARYRRRRPCCGAQSRGLRRAVGGVFVQQRDLLDALPARHHGRRVVVLRLAQHRSLGDDLEYVLVAALGQHVGEGHGQERDAAALGDFRHGQRQRRSVGPDQRDAAILRDQALRHRGGRRGLRSRVGHHQLEPDATQRLDAAGRVDFIRGQFQPLAELMPNCALAPESGRITPTLISAGAASARAGRAATRAAAPNPDKLPAPGMDGLLRFAHGRLLVLVGNGARLLHSALPHYCDGQIISQEYCLTIILLTI